MSRAIASASSSYGFPWVLVLVAVGADLLTKQAAQAFFANGGATVLYPGVLWAQLHGNAGLPYGLFAGAPATLKLLATGLLATGLIVWMAFTPMRSSSALSRTSAALVVGGGLGNLWERLANNHVVTDFLMLGWGHPSTLFGVMNYLPPGA